MYYKKSYAILQYGVLGGAIVVFIGLLLGSKGMVVGNILSMLGIIGMLTGLGQALVFYKCPYCGEHFKVRGKCTDYCPSCGKKLEFNDT